MNTQPPVDGLVSSFFAGFGEKNRFDTPPELPPGGMTRRLAGEHMTGSESCERTEPDGAGRACPDKRVAHAQIKSASSLACLVA